MDGRPRPVPVVLLTDIGRDIDDLLALLVLRSLVADGRAVLAGVVATGGAGIERGLLARQWMQRLNFPDAAGVEVAACLDPGPPEVSTPPWASRNIDAARRRAASVGVGGGLGGGRGAAATGGGAPATGGGGCGVEAAADAAAAAEELGVDISADGAAGLILRCARRWGSELVILAIAPLGPLAQALAVPTTAEDGSGLGGAGLLATARAIWIQGQPSPSPDPTPHTECSPNTSPELEPDVAAAFNLRERAGAATTVFGSLRDALPFRLLGKHTAYKVRLSRRDFGRLDAALEPSAGPGDGELTTQARANLEILLEHSPETFERLYGGRRNDPRWAERLGSLSSPYDALLVLAAFEPELFDWRPVGRPTARAGGMQGAGALVGSDALDDDRHLAVGATPAHPGVRRPRAAQRRLMSHLLRGASCAKNA